MLRKSLFRAPRALRTPVLKAADVEHRQTPTERAQHYAHPLSNVAKLFAFGTEASVLGCATQYMGVIACVKLSMTPFVALAPAAVLIGGALKLVSLKRASLTPENRVAAIVREPLTYGITLPARLSFATGFGFLSVPLIVLNPPIFFPFSVMLALSVAFSAGFAITARSRFPAPNVAAIASAILCALTYSAQAMAGIPLPAPDMFFIAAAAPTIVSSSMAARVAFDRVARMLADSNSAKVQDPELYTRAAIRHALYGEADAVFKLLDLGVSPSCTDKAGRSMLMAAAAHGDAALVQVLIEAGADVHAVSSYGETALQFARQNEREAVVKALIDAGATESESKEGDSPAKTPVPTDATLPTAATPPQAPTTGNSATV